MINLMFRQIANDRVAKCLKALSINEAKYNGLSNDSLRLFKTISRIKASPLVVAHFDILLKHFAELIQIYEDLEKGKFVPKQYFENVATGTINHIIFFEAILIDKDLFESLPEANSPEQSSETSNRTVTKSSIPSTLNV